MSTIVTAGRTDVADFFEKSRKFGKARQAHTPFLLFLQEDDLVRVQVVEKASELLKYADDTPVMSQWQGEYCSDFFQFVVGDYRQHMKEQRVLQEQALTTAHNVVRLVRSSGRVHSLSYQLMYNAKRNRKGKV